MNAYEYKSASNYRCTASCTNTVMEEFCAPTCLPDLVQETRGLLPRCCEDSYHVRFFVPLVCCCSIPSFCSIVRRPGEMDSGPARGVSLVFAFGMRCWLGKETWELGTNERPLRLGSGQGLGHAHLQVYYTRSRSPDDGCCSCTSILLQCSMLVSLPRFPSPSHTPSLPSTLSSVSASSASISRVLRNCLCSFCPFILPARTILSRLLASAPAFSTERPRCPAIFYF